MPEKRLVTASSALVRWTSRADAGIKLSSVKTQREILLFSIIHILPMSCLLSCHGTGGEIS